jgi:hypothetical protein
VSAPDELPAARQVVVAADGPDVGRHGGVETGGQHGVVGELGCGADEGGAGRPGDVGHGGGRAVQHRGDLDGGQAGDPLEDDHHPLPGRERGEDPDERVDRLGRTTRLHQLEAGPRRGVRQLAEVGGVEQPQRDQPWVPDPTPAGVQVGQAGLDQVVGGLALPHQEEGAALQERPLVLDERRVVPVPRQAAHLGPLRRLFGARTFCDAPGARQRGHLCTEFGAQVASLRWSGRSLRRRGPARRAPPASPRAGPRTVRNRCAAGTRRARPWRSAWSAAGCSGCAGR